MSGRQVQISFFTLFLALFAMLGVRGRGQSPAPASGIVLDYFAPPAIDRGLMPDRSRAPDSPESKIRASIRPVNATLERVGVSGSRYVAGKVIVKFRDGVSSAARSSALAVTSAKASLQPSYADFDVVTIDPNEDAEAAARALTARPDVEYAQAAYRVHTQFVPNDTNYRRGLQWNFPLIDLERAWDIQPAAGSNIVVAVIDTGIAYTGVMMRYRASAFGIDSNGDYQRPGGSGTQFPALGDLTLQFVAATELGPSSRFVAPHDFIWEGNLPNPPPIDLDGHGTHVSGTIGQLTNNNAGEAGVAFNVKLMPVKVIDSNWDDIFGSPNQGTDDVVARGIRYAADNGAKVLNMSIGRTGAASPVIEDAIKYAVGKGAFIAIPAGNDFETGNQTEVLAEIASRVPGAVSVAAVDRAKNHAYYSSTGSGVELPAPGGSFRGVGYEGGNLRQNLDFRL